MGTVSTSAGSSGSSRRHTSKSFPNREASLGRTRAMSGDADRPGSHDTPARPKSPPPGLLHGESRTTYTASTPAVDPIAHRIAAQHTTLWSHTTDRGRLVPGRGWNWGTWSSFALARPGFAQLLATPTPDREPWLWTCHCRTPLERQLQTLVRRRGMVIRTHRLARLALQARTTSSNRSRSYHIGN